MDVDGEVPTTVRIDPSQFMLTKDNHRLLSAPVLTEVTASLPPEPVLPRTPEMDDIPEHMHNVEPVMPYSRCVLPDYQDKSWCFFYIHVVILFSAPFLCRLHSVRKFIFFFTINYLHD